MAGTIAGAAPPADGIAVSGGVLATDGLVGAVAAGVASETKPGAAASAALITVSTGPARTFVSTSVDATGAPAAFAFFAFGGVSASGSAPAWALLPADRHVEPGLRGLPHDHASNGLPSLDTKTGVPFGSNLVLTCIAPLVPTYHDLVLSGLVRDTSLRPEVSAATILSGVTWK